VALQILAKLFEDLNRRAIRYCHWKSNLRLERGLQGETDLDLLLDRKHGQIFRQILCEHGVKPVLAPPGRRYPAVEDYLGFDPASGKLFHLHVHYQLVLGEQFVKNYRLPLESHFLDSARLQYGVKIPSPELEIIVLCLRALLKYRDRDVIKDVLSIRTSGLPAHIREEIRHLLEQTSLERIAQTLAGVAEVVPAEVVLEFLNTVVAAPRAGYKFYRLRRRVCRALRPYQRRERFSAGFGYFRELWRRRSFLRFWPEQKMTPRSGGATLALVGADGSGKSTMSQALARWLACKLDVHLYYLGSKQPSRRSELLYLAFRVFRRGHREMCRVLSEANALSRWIAGLRDGLLCTHYLSIGYDRYARYLAGRKKALAGSLVIYDRYPLESIRTGAEYRLLDGPQIPFIADGQAGIIVRALAWAELNLYGKIRPPDYLFALDVSPTVGLQRKPDHNQRGAMLEAKSRAVSELAVRASWENQELGLFALNANLPLEEVLGQLKTKLWELL